MLKQLLISLILLFLLFLMRNIGSYSNWYDKILAGYKEFDDVKNITDVDARRERKYHSKEMYESIKKIMNDSLNSDSVKILLIPSNDFLKASKAAVTLSEPAVIYYVSGLRTVLPYTEMSRKANWALIVINQVPKLIHISSAAERDSLIALYKSYPYTY